MQSARNPPLARRFDFQQDNEPEHESTTIQEWPKNNNANVLEPESRSNR